MLRVAVLPLRCVILVRSPRGVPFLCLCKEKEPKETHPGGPPATGDGNGDGAPDAQQGHVASFPLLTGPALTLAAPAGSALGAARASSTALAHPPRLASFPHGTWAFQAASVAGAGTTVTVFLADADLPHRHIPLGLTCEVPWRAHGRSGPGRSRPLVGDAVAFGDDDLQPQVYRVIRREEHGAEALLFQDRAPGLRRQGWAAGQAQLGVVVRPPPLQQAVGEVGEERVGAHFDE